MAAKKTFKVVIRDLENVIFEGEVDRLSSFNEVGPFDVYPMHANFISIIHQKVALYNHHVKIKELPLEQAVLKVKQDTLQVFMGIEAFSMEGNSTEHKTSS